MVVGILYNTRKTQSLYYLDLLNKMIPEMSYALKGNAWTVLDPRNVSEAEIAASADILISIGGDGTFLSTASQAIRHNIPVLGFNLGTLGLLTEFEAEYPEQSIRRLILGEYIVEDRRTLRVEVLDDRGELLFAEYALNDCVLERNALSGVAYVSLSICDSFVDIYPCNGIVIATQTGSTAYSLSAGGPIIEPGNDVNVVTPICAHITDSRPIVTRASSALELKMSRPHDSMMVSVDGHRNTPFGITNVLRCLPGDKKIKIIRIDPPNFYEALRMKSRERRRKLEDER